MKFNTTLFLLKLSETDKRFIIAFVCLIIFLLAFFILFAILIEYISKKQALKVDSLMHDVVLTGVIDSKKKFIKVARKKNIIYFYKQSLIPVLLILISVTTILIYLGAIGRFDFSLIFTDHGENGVGGVGFATLFNIYDFANAKYVQIIFGWTVIQEIPLLSAAHWSNQAIVSYIFVPIFLIGLTWFVINCQACLARTIRGIRLANSIYEKRLDNVKFDNLKNFKYLNGNITFTNENAVNQNSNNNKKESGNNPNS